MGETGLRVTGGTACALMLPLVWVGHLETVGCCLLLAGEGTEQEHRPAPVPPEPSSAHAPGPVSLQVLTLTLSQVPPPSGSLLALTPSPPPIHHSSISTGCRSFDLPPYLCDASWFTQHPRVVIPIVTGPWWQRLTLILMPWAARSWRRMSHASSRGCLSRSCCRRASFVASPVARANCRTLSRNWTSSSTTLCRVAEPLSPETNYTRAEQ